MVFSGLVLQIVWCGVAVWALLNWVAMELWSFAVLGCACARACARTRGDSRGWIFWLGSEMQSELI